VSARKGMAKVSRNGRSASPAPRGEAIGGRNAPESVRPRDRARKGRAPSTDLRISPREDGTLDEVFVAEPVNVHLEQMADDHWWMGIDLADGSQMMVTLWTGGAKGNRRGSRIFARVEHEKPSEIRRKYRTTRAR
jgi:hypothetical protein